MRILAWSAAVLVSGCAAPPQPLTPARSLAYVSRDQLSVYLVSPREALIVIVNLSGTTRGRLAVGEGVSIVRLKGPNVAQYVLPRGGPTPPPPEGYSKGEATRGWMVVENLPRQNAFPYGTKIVVSLDDLDFGDGSTYSTGPTEMTVEPFPP